MINIDQIKQLREETGVSPTDIKKALDTRNAKSLEWLFDFSAADSGNIIVEYLYPLGNL